jgi:hypothetical protein
MSLGLAIVCLRVVGKYRWVKSRRYRGYFSAQFTLQ